MQGKGGGKTPSPPVEAQLLVIVKKLEKNQFVVLSVFFLL